MHWFWFSISSHISVFVELINHLIIVILYPITIVFTFLIDIQILPPPILLDNLTQVHLFTFL